MRELVASGFNRVFLGTDSAPMHVIAKRAVAAARAASTPQPAGQLRYRL